MIFKITSVAKGDVVMSNLMDRAYDSLETSLIRANLWFKRKIAEPAKEYLRNEDGDIVQTIIILAVFAVITVAVVKVIGDAVKSKGDEAAKTIQDATWG